MQTSFHTEGLDFSRAPDVSGPPSDVRRYSASGESLEALKARTTPIDNTNPYTSSHASCANAFIATAISIEHRYDEMQLPLRVKTADAAPAETFHQTAAMVAEMTHPDVLPATLALLPYEADYRWNDNPEEGEFSLPLLTLSPLYVNPPIVSVEAIDLIEPSVREPEQQPRADATTSEVSEVILNSEYQQQDDEITFSGVAPAGTLLNFYIDDVLVGSTEIDNEGQWQFAVPAELPAAQHIFSAVPIGPQGIPGDKIDVPFVIRSKIGAILMPIDESELEMIDNALIELVTQLDEMPVTLAPLVLTEGLLDNWQMQNGLDLFEPLHHADIFDLDALGNASVIWH